MSKRMRDLIPLVLICLISALLLGAFNLLTKDTIAENTRLAAEQTRARLLPAAATFEEVELEQDSGLNSCHQGLSADGETVGYVLQVPVNGYGGEIIVTVGMDAEAKITGVDVGGENFSETPGLGALAKEPAFTDQYIGKSAPITLAKGNDARTESTIDAISGATRTSGAVNGGVNSAGLYVLNLNAGEGPANTASAKGFAGPVAVTLELDENGAISSIVIGDAFFDETEGYGKKALEDEFKNQFIGMTPPLQLSDIDAISGATVTSTAVVNAINTVYSQLTGAAVETADTVAAATAGATPAVTDSEPADPNTASVKGFAGPVAVTLELDENGAISSITIGDENFAETDGYGKKALEDEFKNQFIGMTPPLQLSDIDAIAGATVTSTAVVDAINTVYTQLGGEVVEVVDATASATSGATAEVTEPEVTAEPVADTTASATSGATADVTEPEVTVEPVADTTASAAAGATADVEEPAADNGEPADPNTASVKGFAGPVAVTLELDENGAISSITIGDENFAETDGYGKKALEDEFKNQFIGMTPPLQLSDIDAIAGATVTSTAVVDAINTVYSQLTGNQP